MNDEEQLLAMSHGARAYDLSLADGRSLRVHDSGSRDSGDSGALTIVWHHGSPQTGALLDPLLTAAQVRGIRLISFGRAGYGGSSALESRNVASIAGDVEQLADASGLDRFAVMGSSGGNPHALACAALLPDRVLGAACFSSLAPFGVAGLDWFAGMADDSALRAALSGRAERERHEETAEFDPASFNDADYVALEGPWASMGADVAASAEWGSGGLIADDLAFVSEWGFDVGDIRAPVLLVQGDDDRITPAAHARWLHEHIPGSELWLQPGGGHISVLNECGAAMDWLAERAF